MKNFFEMIMGREGTPKEIAEALVELEIKEPDFQKAVEVAEDEVIRFNQARLSGHKASGDEVLKATRKLEAARLDLKTIQASKKELEERLYKTIEEVRISLVNDLEAVLPEAGKEREKFKKELAEKILEAQVAYNCFRGEVYGTELLNAVNHHFSQDLPQGDKGPSTYMNLITEAGEITKKRLKSSAVGRMQELQGRVGSNDRSPVDEEVRMLVEAARKSQGAVVGEEGEKQHIEPALN